MVSPVGLGRPLLPHPLIRVHLHSALQYSFPFMEDTVPLWAVPFLTLFLPLLVFVGAYLVSKSTGPFAGSAGEASLWPGPSPFSQSYTHNGQMRRCRRPIALAATVTSLLSIRLLPATATTRRAGPRWRQRTTPASTCWRVFSQPA